MSVQFQKAVKTQRKLRLAITSYEGQGKTWTSLAIATRLAEKAGKRIALADSEGGSASIYADKFDFDMFEMAEHTPEAYVDAVKSADKAGYAVLIIDSFSHEWMGSGGALEQVDAAKAAGGYGWDKVTPRHRKVYEAIIGSDLHIIATMRQKKAWVIDEAQGRNGGRRQTMRATGTEWVQRDDAGFEFDLVATMDNTTFTVFKTRIDTMPLGKQFTKPGADVADALLAFLESGVVAPAKTVATPVVAAPAVEPTAKVIAPSTTPVAPLSNAKTPAELKAMAAREPAATSLPVIRGDVIRLYNEHPSEAAAYISSNKLPKAVADMTRDQATELREYLANLKAVTV